MLYEWPPFFGGITLDHRVKCYSSLELVSRLGHRPTENVAICRQFAGPIADFSV